MTDRQLRNALKAARDFVLFLWGTAILWHEIFDVDQSEPWVLAVGVAFCVSPATIHLDRVFARFLGDAVAAPKSDKDRTE
jgi:hypothetical protein